MPLAFPRRLVYDFSLLLMLIATARMLPAQTPEGPQIPTPDDKIGAVHGQVRLGYYAATHTYRYQGEYEAQTNFARLCGSPLYGFADIDVQALEDSAHGKFEPDRLVGTFEAGARRLFGVAPLSLLIRHQSAHYIDRNDLFQGSWDMVGARWQQAVGKTQVSASLAKYVHIHQVEADYKIDADVQGMTPLGTIGRDPLELHSDLHLVTGQGGRGGFTDYWIEPEIFLSAQTAFFLGYGQIHDTNLSRANTDHPVITGIRLVY